MVSLRRSSFKYWKGVDHTDTEYWDEPWEVEARQMEGFLYEEFLRSLDKSQNTL
jgi:hypothetical protein